MVLRRGQTILAFSGPQMVCFGVLRVKHLKAALFYKQYCIILVTNSYKNSKSKEFKIKRFILNSVPLKNDNIIII